MRLLAGSEDPGCLCRTNYLRWTTVAGVGGEIQLTDALDELLKRDGLNAFETDAGIFDCGNKQGFLSANLAVGMRDPDTRQVIKELIEKSDW